MKLHYLRIFHYFSNSSGYDPGLESNILRNWVDNVHESIGYNPARCIVHTEGHGIIATTGIKDLLGGSAGKLYEHFIFVLYLIDFH